jgi:L-alanine-DL-glutamate epimerase-like enolase superfamily enzyme
MKCGGLRGALRLARLAERAKLRLMWGCMDESVLGIAAALHGAFACPRRRTSTSTAASTSPKTRFPADFRSMATA